MTGWSERAARQRESAGAVCVFLHCHRHVLAIPTTQVERLLLFDEVGREELVTTKLSAGRGVVPVGSLYYASWDLGQMLGLAPLSSAWVLLRVPFLGGEVRLALKTGPCMAVQPLRSTVALPQGAFRARQEGLSRAFAATEVRFGLGDALVGLYVNLVRLWTPSELEISDAAVAEVEARSRAAPRGR